MPIVRGKLEQGKPLIDITLTRHLSAPAFLAPQFQPAPLNLRPYRALLDTGADITCICERGVRELRLESHKVIMMTDGSGARPRRVFWLNVGIVCSDAGAVQIGFDQPATLFQLEPVEAVEIADNRWFELIVGTDTLQRFDFTLKKGGDFTLDLTPR